MRPRPQGAASESMLLVTTSHSILEVDTATGAATPVHRGLGLYYGIASDGESTFVAARGRMVSSSVPHEEERGRVLVFDRDLRLAGELQAPFPMRDMHEAIWHDGSLWVTCSFDNMVAIADLATGSWEAWYPLGRSALPPYDVNHINSLRVEEGALLAIAHNFGQSELLSFDLATRGLRSRVPLGLQSHNIRRRGEAIMTCSSANGLLVDDSGWSVEVGGFPRGLVIGQGGTFVGISEIAERDARDLTTGRIAVLDQGFRVVRTIPLAGEGLVLDLHELPVR
jgi:hypothetical protein